MSGDDAAQSGTSASGSCPHGARSSSGHAVATRNNTGDTSSSDDCLACLICGLPEAQHGEVLARLHDPAIRQLILAHRPCKPTYDVRAEYIPRDKLIRRFPHAFRYTGQRSHSDAEADSPSPSGMTYRTSKQIRLGPETTQSDCELGFRALNSEQAKERIKFKDDCSVIGFDGGRENLRQSSSTESDDNDCRLKKFSLHDQIAANLSNGNIDALELLLDPVTRSNTLFNSQRENFETGKSKSSDDLRQRVFAQPCRCEPPLKPKPVPPPKPSKMSIESKLKELQSGGITTIDEGKYIDPKAQSLRIRVGESRPSIQDTGAAEERPERSRSGSVTNAERKYKSTSCTLIRISDVPPLASDKSEPGPANGDLVHAKPAVAIPPSTEMIGSNILNDTCYFRGRSREREALEEISRMTPPIVVQHKPRTASTPDYVSAALQKSPASNAHDDSNATSAKNGRQTIQIPIKIHAASPVPGGLQRCKSDLSPASPIPGRLRTPDPREEQAVTLDIGLCNHIPRSTKQRSPATLAEDRHYRDYSPRGLSNRSPSRNRLKNFKKLFGIQPKEQQTPRAVSYEGCRSTKFHTPPPASLCSFGTPSSRPKRSHLFHGEDSSCHLDDDDVFISQTVVVKNLTELSKLPSVSAPMRVLSPQPLKKDLDGNPLWNSFSTSTDATTSTSKCNTTTLDSTDIPDDPVKAAEKPAHALPHAYIAVDNKTASMDTASTSDTEQGMLQSGLPTHSKTSLKTDGKMPNSCSIPVIQSARTVVEDVSIVSGHAVKILEGETRIPEPPLMRQNSPSVESNSTNSWMSDGTVSSTTQRDMASMHKDTLQYILAHTPSYAEFWRKSLGLSTADSRTFAWKDITILSDNPILALDYAYFYAAVLRVDKMSIIGPEPFTGSCEHGLPSVLEFCDQIPTRFVRTQKSSNDPPCTGQDGERIACRVTVLPRLLIMTLPMWGANLGQLLHQPKTNQEHRMCFVMLQILEILKTLQFEGVEELPQDLSCFLVIASNHNLEKWPRIAFMRDCLDAPVFASDASSSKGARCVPLCKIGMLVLGCILRGHFGFQQDRSQPNFKADIEKLVFGQIFSRVAHVLNQDHSSSLSKAKALLETAFWLNETPFLSPHAEISADILKNWLEKQRALKVSVMVKNIFGEKDFPDIHNDFHLKFLIKASGSKLLECCRLLQSPVAKVSNVPL